MVSAFAILVSELNIRKVVMNEDTKAWLSQAESDFEDAGLLWDNHRYGAAILFYQQAVEKLLKGYIVETKKRTPKKTHRIEVLLEEAGISDEDIELTTEIPVEELSKSYIRVRYPDLNKQYYQKRENAEPVMKLGKGLYLWVKNRLKKR